MNVKEIVLEYLESKCYAGLYSEDNNCACDKEDLMPCDYIVFNCEPGYKLPCTDSNNCDLGEDCKFHIGIANETT